MIKLFYKALLLSACFLILLTSCSVFPGLQPRSPWLVKWLTNPTCQPPCWENITPGMTRFDDADVMLSKMKGVKLALPPITGPFDNSRGMTWSFDQSRDGVTISTDAQGIVINELVFGVSETVKISEVIEKYGFPTNVMLYECRSEMFNKTCAVDLVYENLGMVLGLNLLKDTGKNDYQVRISPSSEVLRIIFLPTSKDAYIHEIGKNSFNYPQYYFSWKGYTYYP